MDYDAYVGLHYGMVYSNFFSLSFQSDPPKKKPAASGGLAKALGEGKSKGVMGILDECPDEPELEPAIMVIKRAALITDEKTTPMVCENYLKFTTYIECGTGQLQSIGMGVHTLRAC